jgi:hypothetical protein
MSLIKQLTRGALKAGVEDFEEEVLPVEGELEEQILEVVEAQVEAEQAEETVQQLETAAVALEAFVIHLSAASAKGIALSPASAKFMQIGVEHLTSSVGYDKHEFVGLEAFDGETDAVKGTEVSLEGLKDTLTAIWKGIKEAVARAVAAVLAFLGNIFGSVEALDVRARKLSIEATKRKGDVKKGATISLPATVSFKGEASISAIKIGLNDTVSTLETVFKTAGASAKSYYSALAVATAAIAEKKEVDVDAVEASGEAPKGFSEDLLGGKKVVAAKSGSGYSIEGGEGKAGEVEVPSRADIKAIAEGVRKVVAAVKSKKSAVKAIDDEQKAALKAAEALIASSEKAAFGKVVDSAKARWALKGTQYSFTSSLAKVTGIAVKSAAAAVAVGEKAINQYNASKEVAAA